MIFTLFLYLFFIFLNSHYFNNCNFLVCNFFSKVGSSYSHPHSRSNLISEPLSLANTVRPRYNNGKGEVDL